MSQTRKRYVDLAKGVAMLLVIIGHCRYISETTRAIIYSFHMPLFFALSGFTFEADRYKNLKELVVTKFRTLIVPYVFLCLAVWFIRLVAEYRFVISKENLSHLLGIVLCLRLTPFYGTMWFVPALFCAEIPFYLLIRSQKNKTEHLFVFLFLLYVMGIVTLYFMKGFFWGSDLCPMIMAFLLCGYLINDLLKRKKEFITSLWMVMLSGGVTVLAAICNYKMCGSFEMYSGYVGNPALFFISAMGGTVGTIVLCRRVKQCA